MENIEILSKQRSWQNLKKTNVQRTQFWKDSYVASYFGGTNWFFNRIITSSSQYLPWPDANRFVCIFPILPVNFIFIQLSNGETKNICNVLKLTLFVSTKEFFKWKMWKIYIHSENYVASKSFIYTECHTGYWLREQSV